MEMCEKIKNHGETGSSSETLFFSRGRQAVTGQEGPAGTLVLPEKYK
jgi:hypothetical protein